MRLLWSAVIHTFTAAAYRRDHRQKTCISNKQTTLNRLKKSATNYKLCRDGLHIPSFRAN